jgi:hypothetical protein
MLASKRSCLENYLKAKRPLGVTKCQIEFIEQAVCSKRDINVCFHPSAPKPLDSFLSFGRVSGSISIFQYCTRGHSILTASTYVNVDFTLAVSGKETVDIASVLTTWYMPLSYTLTDNHESHL